MDAASGASTTLPFPDNILPDLLAVSLTAVNVLRPVYGPAGEIEDFALTYVNPAGQRMTGLPERPAGTLRTLFPHTVAAGILGYYRRAFEAGAADGHEVNYQADGLDNYFRLAARRSGEWLVVSFTNTADQDRSAVEVALRDAQAREHEARADAEYQRNELRDFMAQAPAAAVLYRGPDHRVELANAAALAIWDRTWEQVRHRPVFEVLPEAATPAVVALFDGVYATGTPHTAYELPTTIMRHGQPEVVHWNFVFKPERQPDGRISGIVSLGTDVTEHVLARQRAEQLARELEARVQERTQAALALQADLLAAARQQAEQRATLYQVFEQTPAAVALLRDPGHCFDYVNPAYQAFFPGRPLLGREAAEAAPELVTQGFTALLDRVYQSGETHFGQEQPFTPSPAAGEAPRPRYFNFTYQAYCENDVIAGVSIFAFDVTEQVLARQQRDAERRQLQAVFAQAPVAVCVFQGEEYVFDLVNPLMAQMLARPQAALLGQPFFRVLPELRGQGLPALLAGVRRTGTPFVAQEQKLQLAHHRPGYPGYYNFVYQPLHADDGLVAGIVCVATEVTEQVQARQRVQELNEEMATVNEELRVTNEELHKANQQLTRTNVDLDTFVYTASHDLKAPIANLEGLLTLLGQELPPAVAGSEYVAPTLQHMREAVERFQRTIDHLTEVAKLQNEHAPVEAAVNLAAVVEDVRRDLAPLLRETKAQLRVALASVPTVWLSEKNLRSVVYNLLSNALKYRAPDRPPHVDMRTHFRPGYTVLEVQDNGLGLAAAQLPKLFGLFQRFHSHVEGTGIGLYMVKRMVENAGGRIEVHSQPGVGTTFFVHLPHAPTRPPGPFLR